MSAETMTDAQADALIEAVGERMGMHQGAWDMVNGRELARAFAAELRATPPDGPVVTIEMSEDGECWIPMIDHHLLEGLIQPGACQRFRLVPEGETK